MFSWQPFFGTLRYFPPCEILNTDTKENSGQPLGMRKGINSDRLRTISRANMRNTIAVLQNKKKKIETFIWNLGKETKVEKGKT